MTPGDLQDSRETLKVQNSSYISKGDKENSEHYLRQKSKGYYTWCIDSSSKCEFENIIEK